jgi:hypothetical protein
MRIPAVHFIIAIAASSAAVAGEKGDVWRTPSCGCCMAWVDHMRAGGFDLTVSDLPRSELNAKKSVLGIAEKYAGCHTAKIGSYVIEGHVPAADVKRLLSEKPDAIGLSVAGMPAGSPGMETGGSSDPYDVVLVRKDGSSEVFAHHGDAVPAIKN